MRKSIDTYINAIAHNNELYIRESYMTVADYIINNAENCSGYYEFFDDEELDETGKPTEAQIDELKAYLREYYTTPIEHRLHHTHIFENGDEQEIVIPYENGEHKL